MEEASATTSRDANAVFSHRKAEFKVSRPDQLIAMLFDSEKVFAVGCERLMVWQKDALR
jgi:hypothetical protein